MCCLYRYIYAPYQILKWSGIKGPTPIPFFGNYFQIQKQVNHYLFLWSISYHCVCWMAMTLAIIGCEAEDYNYANMSSGGGARVV